MSPLRSAVRLELHRDAVHAEALTGRPRAVLEDVAQMPAAVRAMHFGAGHEPGAVGRGFGRTVQRLPEARPSGAALVFRVRGVERLAAAGARERAFALLWIERARAGALGAVLT